MITLPDFKTLDPNAVAQARSTLSKALQEYATDLELRRGVIQGITLDLDAVVYTALDSAVQQLITSQDVAVVQQNPTAADPDTVDALAANFRATRKPATTASGSMLVILDSLVPIVIPAGMIFTTNGVSFTADNTVSARTDPSLVTSPTDVVISPYGPGRYAFAISVTAQVSGSVAVPAGTSFIIPSAPDHVLEGVSNTDFIGTDAESNASLVGRLLPAMASPGVGSRPSLESLLRSQFSSIQAVSIMGFGDPEQIRYHSLFPLAFGGREDVYVRTSPLPSLITYIATAVLIEKTVSGGIWQLSIGRNIAPGFYEAYKIRREDLFTWDGASYSITADVRGVDLTGSIYVPDLMLLSESVYSRYQTTVLQFLDTDTDTGSVSIGGTQSYTVILKALPQIADIQDFIGNTANEPATGDVLVRAPIPCFVTVSGTVTVPSGTPTVTIESLTTALVNYVGGLAFTGILAASSLQAVLHSVLSQGQTVGNLSLTGHIRYPDGSEQNLSSTTSLIIPDNAIQQVSKNTVNFYLDPSDVALTILNS